MGNTDPAAKHKKKKKKKQAEQRKEDDGKQERRAKQKVGKVKEIRQKKNGVFKIKA